MVAIIHASSSLRHALNYNEQKVNEGQATCLAAGNYPKEAGDLTFSQKLNRLLNLAALNLRTKVNSVHISLNFDPSENLSEEKLKAIADTYLQKIGFAQQPYLLYQHHDAGHPHVHIVTTNIQSNGKRIKLHNLGRNESEQARQEIEEIFGLVKAEDPKKRQSYELNPVRVQKVQYGRSETKRAITNVLDVVLKTYKYTSLPELNAVLGQYNIVADPGSETSRVHQHQGLLYRIVDERGNRVGVPIKASDFHHKPTLKYLEEKFRQNEAARQPQKTRVKSAVDLTLLKQPNLTLTNLMKALAKEGITIVPRQNADDRVYGITYVDHQTKCVYNGSALGKQYSAQGIQQRCAPAVSLTPSPVGQQPGEKQTLQTDAKSGERAASQEPTKPQGNLKNHPTPPEPLHHSDTGNLLSILLQPKIEADYVPPALKKSSRKKKKKGINNPQ